MGRKNEGWLGWLVGESAAESVEWVVIFSRMVMADIRGCLLWRVTKGMKARCIPDSV